MSNYDLSVKTRTAMARNLAKFLEEHANIEIKHTLANKAIASIFGHNEHSLSAAIKNQAKFQTEANSDGSSNHKCSVPGCNSDANVEVRLFDIYLQLDPALVFDEVDITCPYLCMRHLVENERNASGERKPRGYVKYPFSNKKLAQGFTIYRNLQIKTNSLEEIVDYGEGWTLDAALATKLVTFLRREGNTFFLKIGSLKTEISILLRDDGDGIEFTPSHAIKTPLQLAPYRTSHPWGDYPGYALRRAIVGLTQYYEDAVRQELTPEEGWLVPY